MPPEKRGGGGGSAMLSALWERLPEDGVLMIESEAPTGDPVADETILRRLRFYQRCGATPAGFDAAVFGVRYRLLFLSRRSPDTAELLRRYRALYRGRFTETAWKRFFRIPLGEDEPAPQVESWTEEGLSHENG